MNNETLTIRHEVSEGIHAEAWIIEIDNPFEDGETTEVARFSQNEANIRRAVALAALTIAEARGISVTVEASKPGEKKSMMNHLLKAAKTLGF